MSYQSEHRKFKLLLDRCRELDIADNPDPRALYDPGSGGFQIWATPEDHPDDQVWLAALNEKEMTTGAFSKPCAFVASVVWRWDEEAEKVIGFEIETSPYHLRDAGVISQAQLTNRLADLAWARQKVRWLWRRCEYVQPCPEMMTREQWEELEKLQKGDL